MSDIEYKIRKICDRKQKTLSTIESVPSAFVIAFGLGNFNLLPAAANTFYFLPVLNVWVPSGTTVTGVPQLQLTNNGGGSGGTPYLAPVTNNYFTLFDVETAIMNYLVGSHSAGSFFVTGSFFKITTA